ncbi:hypothetical protein H17ap60334_08713 [Thermosipho africanus H17ap60334]|jgi:predicted nucleotidyltransferase|uniref:nucleotidyltransferase n=1 Tax=Thermosipho africanus TaxID=2421 RepID=UPI00028DD759|nr:nucleotidyltransferase [Thermosipho africanus]EKF48926.1 hypothetical protein H17ap60334_08713 [Thermosipho africanus H17ap60334]MDK2840030.1 hypothetical protein [Thermosipho sp. (in: thermotogales)]
MKVLGVVVEYNPFHNGHLYHLKSAKKLVKPDFTIAVMSGNFCQRGEPAIVNKFARAKMALLNGIDVVFEIPTVYALQDAGGFAFGSVGLMHKLGLVTDIVFGSESADISFLEKISKILYENSKEFDYLIKRELKKGLSYPNARKFALQKFLKTDLDTIKKLENSNDILGIEYIKAIFKYNSNIKYHVIKRVGAKYNEQNLSGKFSSATAIRNAIKFEKNIKEYVPESTYLILKDEFEKGRGPVFLENLEQFILSEFRLKARENLENIYGFSEGLDKRFIDSANISTNLKEFIENIKAKRFTFSRIRRLIFHAIFNFEKNYMEFSNKLGPQYARVLGFTTKGQEFLSYAKKKSTIPIITNPSLKNKILKDVLKNSERKWDFNISLYNWQFEKDILASNIYTLFYPNSSQRKSGMDFRKPIIIEG